MKKLLLLLALAPLLMVSSCGGDDDNSEGTATYDTTKGYTVNMASVKHGIVGRWSNGISDVSCSAGGDYCTGSSLDQTLTNCVRYTVTSEGGKFYLNTISSIAERYNSKYELLELTKTYYRMKDTKDNVTFRYDRITTAPTP